MKFCHHTNDVTCPNCEPDRKMVRYGDRTDPVGWICPACGSGNAPWNPVCWCRPKDKETTSP